MILSRRFKICCSKEPKLPLLNPLSLIRAALLVSLVSSSFAQSGSGSPPLTYDYNPAVAGIQPPLFLGSASADYRSLRTYQVNIPVLVPISELQSLMPAGFTALETPSGSNTGTLTLGF